MYLKQSDATAARQLHSQRKRDLLAHYEANGDELDRWREFNAASAEFTADGASAGSSPRSMTR